VGDTTDLSYQVPRPLSGNPDDRVRSRAMEQRPYASRRLLWRRLGSIGLAISVVACKGCYVPMRHNLSGNEDQQMYAMTVILAAPTSTW
jgi:hypothetical protein